MGTLTSLQKVGLLMLVLYWLTTTFHPLPDFFQGFFVGLGTCLVLLGGLQTRFKRNKMNLIEGIKINR